MTRRFGTHRTAYLTRKYAFKVPALREWRLFLLGLLANMQEARFWRDTHWPELCPVLFSLRGGFLVVMKRADPLSRERFLSFEYAEFVNKAMYHVPVENKLDSFGEIDG
jgi:hypothetical protein